MRVSARRRKGLAHSLTAGHHTLIADEPAEKGGTNTGPSPSQLLALSLSSCTAVTIEMYADRKGWDLGQIEVVADMEYGQPAVPRSFLVTLKLPKELSEEQQQRLGVIAGKCPVHRVLSRDAEVEVEDRIELV